MRKKVYRGFHTGNTLRRTNERLLKSHEKEKYSKKSLNDTEGVIQFTHYYDSDYLETEFKFDGQEFFPGVPYSIKKRKRWRLRHHIEQRLEDDKNPFCDIGIEVAEGHVIGQRGPRAKYLLRKMPGDSEIRELEWRHGFLSLCRARGEMVLLEKQEKQAKRSPKEKAKKEISSDSSDGEDEDENKNRRWVYFEITKAVRPKMLNRLDQEPKKENYFRYHWYERETYGDARKGPKIFKVNYFDKEFMTDDESEDVELDDEAPIATSETVPRKVALEDLVVKKTKSSSDRRRHRTKSSSNDAPSCKSKKIFVELADDTDAKDESATVTVPDSVTDLTDPLSMKATRHEIVSSAVSPDVLSQTFGDMYIEGACYPRKFALDLSHSFHELTSTDESPLRKNVYLIFEEICAGVVTSDYDIYLNIDVENMDVTSIFHWYDRYINDLRQFADDCTVKVMEQYGESIRSRKMPVIHRYEAPTAPFLSSRTSPVSEDRFLSISEKQIALNSNAKAGRPLLTDENGNFSCGICFDSIRFPSSSLKDCGDLDMSSGCGLLSCGHCFCHECWRMHFIATIRTGMCDLKCPAIDCSTMVDLVTVLRHISLIVYTPHVIRLEANDVDLDPNMAWCPAPKCGRLVKLTPSSDACHASVKCHCGYWFCFTCREEAHWPASCDAYRFYTKKMKSLGDTETVLANDCALRVKGKNCPRCKKFIEKNGGCPHMHCTCGYDFCWTCGASYYDPDHDDCYEDRPGPDEWKTIGVAEAIVTPSEARQRDYSEALKWRLRRLHVRLRMEFLLNIMNLRKLIKCKNVNHNGHAHNGINVVEESHATNAKFQELIGVVEFLFASTLNISTDHLLLVKRVRYLAVTLASIVTEIRDLVNNNTLFTAERWLTFESKMKEARRKVRLVENKFCATLNDDRITRPMKETATGDFLQS